ncbi:phosphate ABC transporter substrate-binding protein PstS [Saccharomonospora piscinae]|uniref:Phosphate-binding protein n=1 Tax=Saccharomonospora piscinae TaxID=687388 RepID=A0A1V9A7H4_SACPI|nr:phosphate ABC transporter substrate-binding protein PstS [Saccharomonospora piscinae]OQO93043.1 phosphate ABC transporter substrate-binding protein PstS [Saccharomonospora piscinae]TLW93178.1 phosphate ABC transporter substrate-binding protein PstS [Saccharomonospora piscinae]
MKRYPLGRVIALPAAAALTFGIAACGSANEESSGQGGDGSGLSGTISGAGASSQEAAQKAWQASFLDANPDVTVNYDPIGSGGGREQFVSGGSDFGGTDAFLDDEELAGAQERCGEVVEIPTYVSPVAVVFNLEGVEELNLKPATIAKIFNQEITNWNDPEIAADNPDADLPDQAITPVNRSDESGTTENFVEYLTAAAPEDWPHEVSGDWPVQGGEAAQGTSGVVQAVANGNGAIGYADASMAGDLGTVKVGVGEEFVSYSPEAAAKVLEVSERIEGRGDYSFAYELARDTTEEGTYPIVLVSYALACANYDDADTAEVVKAYFDYMISSEGQQASAENAGSAPISDALRQELQPAVDAIGSGS